MTNAAVDADLAPRPTCPQLFMGFLGIGIMGFGGVLPLARRMLVEDRKWLEPEEFTDLLGLCQFLPGGNIINMSVAIGMKFRGWRGALSGILGLTAVPTLFVIILGVIYDQYRNDPHVQQLFAGLAAAAAGLLIALAVKLLIPILKKPQALLIAGLLILAVAFLRVPMLAAMLVLAPVSVLLAWRAGR